MRTIFFLPFYCGALALSNADQLPARAPIQETPTEVELADKFKQVQQQAPKTENASPAGSDKKAVSVPQDLMSSSEILCYGDAMTLVPKHAVLQTPRNLAARLKQDPEAKLVTWSDFYPANRSWITTIEVSPEQAEGKVPLSIETSNLMTKSGKVAVATYNGNPISVLITNAPTTAIPTPPTSRP